MNSLFAKKTAVRKSFIQFVVTALIICVLPGLLLGQKPNCQKHSGFKVLLFSKTAGYRHQIIPQGIVEIAKLGIENNFDVDATEDSKLFTDENLKQYKVIIFLNTTGDIFNDEQQGATERFIRSGKGFVGIHSSTDTEYEWEWYGGLIAGAYFKAHPKVQEARILVEDYNHPSTCMLPYNWKMTDEWYEFRENPRGKVKVLASLDENSYNVKEGMGDHPIVWCHIYDGGRIFYTGLGHTRETFTSSVFLNHLLGGIKWAAGECNCR